MNVYNIIYRCVVLAKRYDFVSCLLNGTRGGKQVAPKHIPVSVSAFAVVANNVDTAVHVIISSIVNIYVYTYIYIHVCMCICIFIYACVNC